MALGNHIEINGSATHTNRLLRNNITTLQAARDGIAALKGIFDEAAIGPNWANLAALLGIESAADAEAVYNLTTNVYTAMTGADFDYYLRRLG